MNNLINYSNDELYNVVQNDEYLYNQYEAIENENEINDFILELESLDNKELKNKIAFFILKDWS